MTIKTVKQIIQILVSNNEINLAFKLAESFIIGLEYTAMFNVENNSYPLLNNDERLKIVLELPEFIAKKVREQKND